MIVVGYYCFTLCSSPEPKAPDSAQDDLLWSVAIHRPSIRPLSPLNDFSSETPGPTFFKFHVESSVNGVLKICSNGHGLN